MKYIFFLFIIYIYPVGYIYADSGSLYQGVSERLNKIVRIDSTLQDTKKTPLIRSRNALLDLVRRDMPRLADIWTLRPTFDLSTQYIPYLQNYKLSCEIAAAHMITTALGKPFSEDEILKEIPQYRASMDQSGGIWGDPEKEFVGSYTGSQRLRTGYGVYEAPLANILSGSFLTEIHNRNTYKKGMTPKKHLTHLIEAIEKGDHVLLWGDWCTTPEYDDGVFPTYTDHAFIIGYSPLSAKNTCDRSLTDRQFSWKTEDGKTINALSGEHAFVLLGYIGKRTNPTHIIVWDTDTGRHIYPITEWMRKWRLLDYRSLIIAKKE